MTVIHLLKNTPYLKRWDNAVSAVGRAGITFQAAARHFSPLEKVHTGTEAQPTPLFNSHRQVLFPWVKRTGSETDFSLPPSPNTKNE